MAQPNTQEAMAILRQQLAEDADQKRMRETFAAMTAPGVFPLQLEVRRLLKRVYLLTYRPAGDDVDLEEVQAKFSNLVHEEGYRDPVPRAREGSAAELETIRTVKRRCQPKREAYTGEILRDEEGNQIDEWVDKLVEVQDTPTWWGDLVRTMARRVGLPARSWSRYDAQELCAILLAGLEAYDKAASTDEGRRRGDLYPHWPESWESAIATGRNLARVVAEKNQESREP